MLLPAVESRRARVWQVEHYAGDIARKKCEDSLDDAIATYDPEAVIFVFPRNLSQPLRATFTGRLVGRHPTVSITHWGLQRTQDELASHSDICTRYFGEDRADVLPGLLRVYQPRYASFVSHGGGARAGSRYFCSTTSVAVSAPSIQPCAPE